MKIKFSIYGFFSQEISLDSLQTDFFFFYRGRGMSLHDILWKTYPLQIKFLLQENLLFILPLPLLLYVSHKFNWHASTLKVNTV